MATTSATPLPSLGVLPDTSNKSNGGPPKQTLSSTPKPSLRESSLSIEIDGKPALIRYDQEFLYVFRGNHKESDEIDIYRSYLLVPLALVLHASFVSDSDGGSLLVRVLSPPLTSKSPLAVYLKKQREKESLNQTSSTTESSSRSKLKSYLEGPCSNLRLMKIEARLSDRNSTGTEGIEWSSRVMKSSYDSFGVSPFRRLKILINPIGGQGKSVTLFEQKIRPILEASGCKLSIELTKYRNHGLEISKDLDISKFDSLICVSGDGMLHEVLNGFSQRSDSKEAFKKISIAPIPTGSGNASSVNLLGPKNGFSLSIACLNIIKGRRLNLDVCSITQPETGSEPINLNHNYDNSNDSNGLNSNVIQDSTPSSISNPPKLPFVRYYSFLSQAIGMMADLDLGTESMRALGDARFFIGFFNGVVKNATCEVDVDVKIGKNGSVNKKEMRKKRLEFDWNSIISDDNDQEGLEDDEEEVRNQIIDETERTEGTETGEESKAWRTDALGDKIPSKTLGMPNLIHGAVTDDLGDLSETDLIDPSWPITQDSSNSNPPSGWTRIKVPISSLYAGKLPYVSRDLLQFPYTIPGDGTLDLALQTLKGGRMGKIMAIQGAETGQVVFNKALIYLKVEAFRVTPRLKEGDKRLQKGGLISIDGERVKWNPFQVEVCKGIKFGLLSLYGHLVTPDVKPEGLEGKYDWENEENH